MTERPYLIILPIALAGLFLVALDATIIAGTPSIFMSQWTGSALAVATVILLPIAGALADRYGPRRLMLGSIGLLAAGGIAAACMPASSTLAAAVILMAVPGSLLFPIAMSYLWHMTPARLRALVMGTLGIPYFCGPAIQWFLTNRGAQGLSLREIFVGQALLGLICCALGIAHLPPTALYPVAIRDGLGLVLGPISMAILAYGSVQSIDNLKSVQAAGGLVAGSLLLLVFAGVELRAREPVVYFHVLRSASFRKAVAAWLVALATGVGLGLSGPTLFSHLHMGGAFRHGYSLVPTAIAAALVTPLAICFLHRFGAWLVCVAGGVLLASAALLWLALPTSAQGLDYLPSTVAYGAGYGLVYMPMAVFLLCITPPDSTNRVVALLVSVAAMTHMLTTAYIGHTLIYQNTIDFSGWLQRDLPQALHHDLRILAALGILVSIMGLVLRTDAQEISTSRVP